jgi:hypothetical protein
MITILDCFNQLITICDRLTTTKTPAIKPDKTIDQAIAAAEEIIGIYDAVQTDIDQKIKETARINEERRAVGDRDTLPYRPRSSYYKFWDTFNPDIAISVLNTLIKTCDRKLTKIINKLTEIVKPFRVQEQEQVAPRSLGLKSYQFNPYAVWVNSFSDHKLPYKVWLQA